MEKVTVLGAGHWGIALSEALAFNGVKVKVWARKEQVASDINEKNESNYFKDKKLNKNIIATIDLEEAFAFSDTILVALPVVVIYDFLKPWIEKFNKKTYLLTSKGLYQGKSISNLLHELDKNLDVAVLSGPSFSEEVMEHKYTAVCIAGNTKTASYLQELFTSKFFRVYTSNDIIGVEYCGAIKNVFAIICGMVDGNKMGCNTKNAIITRGLAEISQVVSFVGGDPKTLHGLAGIGDIMLTCNSFESRNYSYGYNYNKNSDTNCQQNGTIEGLNTIREIYKIAHDNNLNMPIIDSLHKILFEHSTIDVEAQVLMGRSKKMED